MSIINVDVFGKLMKSTAETRKKCKQVIGCFTAAFDALNGDESVDQLRNHLKNAAKFIIRLNDLCGKRLCNAYIRSDDYNQTAEIYHELTQNAYESMKKRVLLNGKEGDDI